MPEGAVYVGRPTIFGNPFRPIKSSCCPNWDVIDDNDVRYLIDHERAHRAPRHTAVTKAEAIWETVRLYEADLTEWFGGRISMDPDLRKAIEGLRGKDLCCWCPLPEPGERDVCHAAVLLRLANSDGDV